MKKYDHKAIEKKWQKNWEDAGLYKVSDFVEGKENFYQLVEFSYPSGNLHTGHWYAFAVPDIYARYKRMKGFNVLYPMGFDAFGLPAENAAIKLGADPKVWTYQQMDTMREQLRSMGASFDWSREVVSCDPEYYKWTQWMFTEFLNNDLVYRANTKVNWCPKDQTILANEQVVDGICERCGTEVIQRDQDQWMLRITKYADRLIDDLDRLDWPDSIKESQKNWIGRSEGAEITFKLSTGDNIAVFTTRPDTLFGVTYVVLAPESKLVFDLKDSIQNWDEVKNYIEETKKKSPLDRQKGEKTGVPLHGVFAVNPANGEEVPVWIADYVLADYGTGAVMAVPAHDERDWEFAKKYKLEIRDVIIPSIIDHKNPHKENWPVVERNNIHAVVYDPKNDSYLTLTWKNHNWKTIVLGGIDEGEDVIAAAKREVLEETGYKNIEFKKYLGSPIQSLYSADHKQQNRIAYSYGLYFELINDEQEEVSSSEKDLFNVVWMNSKEFIPENITNVELSFWLDRIKNDKKPYIESGVLINSHNFKGITSEEAKVKITEFVGGKMKTTYKLRDWGISRQRYWGCPIPIVYDPEGKAHPVPEQHLPWLLPTDVDHAPDGTPPLARSRELFERTEKIFGKGWKPEVETMDTFVDSSWYFYRYLDNKNDKTFADKERLKSWMPIDLYMGGAEHTTMHLLYSRFWTKALFDLGLVSEEEAYKIRRNRGLILGPDGNKMSKSKGNVINPDEIVDRLGADTVRMYLAFMGPYGTTANYPWDPNGVVGVRRFLERVVSYFDSWKDDYEKDIKDSPQINEKQYNSEYLDSSIDKLIHKTVKKVSEDISSFKFNTAVSSLMVLMNELHKDLNTGLIESAPVTIPQMKKILQLLAPFAPHVAEELWYELGNTSSIHKSVWPEFDESKMVEDEVTIAVQINGKIKGSLTVSFDATQDDVWQKIQENETIAKYITGEPKKIIFVPNKLISIVL